jgi:hypothetical protein
VSFSVAAEGLGVVVVFVIAFLLALTAILLKLRQATLRIDAIEEDQELDRRFAMGDRRELLHMIQIQDELAILDTVEPGRKRIIVSEWTRDYLDERIPDPHHQGPVRW